MKPKYLISIFTICAASGLLAAIALQNSQPQSSKNSKEVALKDGKASPSIVAVKKGGFVQFNSLDGREHNLIQDAPHDHSEVYEDGQAKAWKGLNSGIFKSDEAWRVQFKETGNYTFYDRLNSKIVVTVVAHN